MSITFASKKKKKNNNNNKKNQFGVDKHAIWSDYSFTRWQYDSKVGVHCKAVTKDLGFLFETFKHPLPGWQVLMRKTEHGWKDSPSPHPCGFAPPLERFLGAALMPTLGFLPFFLGAMEHS